jgi:hypothetical protein
MKKARFIALGLMVAAFGTIALSAAADGPAPQPPTVEKIRVARDDAFRVKGEKTFFFRGEFMIDADGAPTAYHPGYTCDKSYAKGWKHATGIDCSKRALDHCRVKGFAGDVADGAVGDYVRCGTRKVGGAWTCAEISRTKLRQGGCTTDAASAKGLDWLPNAGEPGNFYGIATKDGTKTGEPIVQGPNDPAPGFYVSSTALVNPKAKEGTVERYVDSSRFNYVALPPSAMHHGAQKGDFVAAINWKTGAVAGAIFGDVGSDGDDDLGEGSIALAKELGVRGSPKGGGAHEDIVYVVFSGTTQGFPTDPAKVQQEGLARFKAWGGVDRLKQLKPEWAADYAKPHK